MDGSFHRFNSSGYFKYRLFGSPDVKENYMIHVPFCITPEVIKSFVDCSCSLLIFLCSGERAVLKMTAEI